MGKKISMPKTPLKHIYGQYVVGLEPFGTFKSGFGCYHSSILVLRVRKAVKMGNFAYFSFLDYQSSNHFFYGPDVSGWVQMKGTGPH